MWNDKKKKKENQYLGAKTTKMKKGKRKKARFDKKGGKDGEWGIK